MKKTKIKNIEETRENIIIKFNSSKRSDIILENKGFKKITLETNKIYSLIYFISLPVLITTLFYYFKNRSEIKILIFIACFWILISIYEYIILKKNSDIVIKYD